jgi:predicted RNA methylase
VCAAAVLKARGGCPFLAGAGRSGLTVEAGSPLFLRGVVVRLICGDCLEVMKTLPDASVDMVCADPPYGTETTEWDHSVDERFFSECLRVSRGYSVFFYSNTRLWHILGIIKAIGRDAWVIPWHKSNAMGFERRFAPQWVPIVCVYSGGLPFWGQDYVNCPIVPQDVDHPTPKPVAVVRWLIKRATKEGDTVLDPCMGSGTTGVACVQTGRDFVGIEKDAGYFAVAQKRIAEAENATPLFASLPETRQPEPSLFP